MNTKKTTPDYRGYIFLYRKLVDSFIFSDSEALHLWIYILLHANWKDKEIILEGKKETIKRGEFITSQVKMANKTDINRIKINRLLKLFKNEHLIEHQTTNKFTRIKVINYDKYQTSEHQDEQQMNSKRTANEQQMNTTNNNKNNNKDNKDNKKKEKSNIPIKSFINGFNKLFNRQFRVTDKRRKKLKLRLETFTYEEIKQAVINLSKSSFHRGDNDRGWSADPDFLLKNDEQIDKWLNYKRGSDKKTLAEQLEEGGEK